MHIIFNLILIFALHTLISGMVEKKFSDVAYGVFAIVVGFGFLIDSWRRAKEFGIEGKSFRMDGSLYVLFACIVPVRTAFYRLPFTFNLIFACSSVAIVGLALILLSPSHSTEQTVFAYTAAGAKARRFRMPEYLVRLCVFAACLAIAAIATVLLLKDEKLRLACFLITMITGLVSAKVLPLKALKWVLNAFSLGKLKADQ